MAGNRSHSELQHQLALTREALEHRVQEQEALYRAGIALSSQRDLPALYHLILHTARALTSADAATLYLIENQDERRCLVFSAAQTASSETSYERRMLALTVESVAGFVAVTGETLNVADAYQLPASAPYGFNSSFDRATGYRTRSLLSVPMLNLDGVVVGVVQLVNRKRDPDVRLLDEVTVAREVLAFEARDERVLRALASQAAVAIENRRLLETDRLYQQLQEYVREVEKVTNAAASVEAGTFEPESLAGVVERTDALGALARVFSSMAREVQYRERRLRQQVQQLQIEIDHERKAREVAAVTDSDYFRELKRAVRDMREESTQRREP